MAIPPEYPWFGKILSRHLQIEKMLGPTSGIFAQYQNYINSAKASALEFQKLNSPAIHLNDYLSVSGFSKKYISLQQQIESNLGSVSSILKELDSFKTAEAFRSVVAQQENLYRIQDRFLKYEIMSKLPSARIESVLAAAEASSRLCSKNNLFTDLTLSAVSEYQSFISKQYKLLTFDKDIIAERRIEISELSGDLFEVVNASLEIGNVLEGKGEIHREDNNFNEIIDTGLYSQVNQHLGFVYSSSFNGIIKQRFNDSIPVKINRLGFSIIEQISKINSIFESYGDDPVFTPTTKTMSACGIIPAVLAIDEFGFHNLLDYMYFLLYEGSGAAKRLTAITHESNLDPLWKIKHIRLSARHDIDHGSRQEIDRKRAKIRDCYISLISKPIPLRQSDWQKAQLNIYVEIDYMLRKIIQEIIERKASG